MLLSKFYQEKSTYPTRNMPSRQTASNMLGPERNHLDIHNVLRSAGKPLDHATRTAMEANFDHDFSQVRIHSDKKAAESARAINALAYTVGRDVVFGAGQFNPYSVNGRRLLAHELAHVVQQGNAAYQRGMVLHMDSPDSQLERQAQSMAKNPAQGRSVPANRISNEMTVQRSVESPRAASGSGLGTSNSVCSGWFRDHQSITKVAAENYVHNELQGNRGHVEQIVCDLFDPVSGAYACTNYFSDGTPIRVIVRKDVIIVGVAPLSSMYPPPDRPLCWYDYKCVGANRQLVLTKRKCQSAKTAGSSTSGSSGTSQSP